MVIQISVLNHQCIAIADFYLKTKIDLIAKFRWLNKKR